MHHRAPIERANVLLEKTTPLTNEEKDLFAYFGVDAKVLPPLRVLNPQFISIGDVTSIRDGCHINAFADLSFLLDYVDEKYRGDFDAADYRYEPQIQIGRENQIGRFAFLSCTGSITLEENVLISERVFIGDNNHGFSHPNVPIMQQPNERGRPIVIGRGTWIGVGAAILAGTQLGTNCVVGANSVCRGGLYPSHSVIGPDSARVLYSRVKNDE
jgi:acetyltransferase-like isoleucine patch superfamily enzyme